MRAWVFDDPLRRTVLTAIDVYREHLSPRKGFACAHRVLHGGASCSERVRRAFAEASLSEALAISRQQFGACAGAGEILRQRNNRGNFRCIVIPCCLPL